MRSCGTNRCLLHQGTVGHDRASSNVGNSRIAGDLVSEAALNYPAAERVEDKPSA